MGPGGTEKSEDGNLSGAGCGKYIVFGRETEVGYESIGSNFASIIGGNTVPYVLGIILAIGIYQIDRAYTLTASRRLPMLGSGSHCALIKESCRSQPSIACHHK